MQAFCLRLCLSVVTVVLSTWMFLAPAGLAAPTPAAIPSLLPTIVASATTAKSPAVVTLTDRFKVSKQEKAAFLDRWQQLQNYMQQQPGFISAELKNKPMGSPDWIMSEEWQSVEAYKTAVSQPEFQALVKDFPAKATWFAPDLFPTK